MQREVIGFRPEEDVYRLRFKDPKLDGLVVDMAGMEVGSFMELAGMADLDPKSFRPEDIPRIRRLFEIVAEGLIEWNLLDRNNEPVPADIKGLLAQKVPLVFAIVEGWMTAVGSVPAPLEQPSADGRLSAVASLPMEPRSASLPS